MCSAGSACCKLGHGTIKPGSINQEKLYFFPDERLKVFCKLLNFFIQKKDNSWTTFTLSEFAAYLSDMYQKPDISIFGLYNSTDLGKSCLVLIDENTYAVRKEVIKACFFQAPRIWY